MKSKPYSNILFILALIIPMLGWGQQGYYYRSSMTGQVLYEPPPPPPEKPVPYKTSSTYGTGGGYVASSFKIIEFHYKKSKYYKAFIEYGVVKYDASKYVYGDGILRDEDKKTVNMYGTLKTYGSEGGNDLPVEKWTGDWINGKLNGEGTWTYGTWTSTIQSYDGEWKNWLFDGHGIYKLYTDYYDGEWKMGVKDGQGTYTWDSGRCKYIGMFKAGTYNGQGTLTTPDFTCTGEWKDGRQNGWCIWKSKTESYEGQWQNGYHYGHGVYVYSDGSKYDGEFNNGNWWGPGTYTSQKGFKFCGSFYYRKPMNCQYKVYYPNGNLEEEYLLIDSFIDGKAKYYYENGKIFADANYKKGVRDGAYKTYYENGMLWSDYIYRDGKLLNTISDNMPDGTPTGTSVKDGNGVSMGQSADGKVIISKTTYENGVAVKTETIPAK